VPETAFQFTVTLLYLIGFALKPETASGNVNELAWADTDGAGLCAGDVAPVMFDWIS